MVYHVLFFSTLQNEATKLACISAAAYYKWTFEEVDMNNYKNNYLVSKHQVKLEPTIVVLKYGKEIYKTSGFKNSQALIEYFKDL
jgi:hypothetical protein